MVSGLSEGMSATDRKVFEGFEGLPRRHPVTPKDFLCSSVGLILDLYFRETNLSIAKLIKFLAVIDFTLGKYRINNRYLFVNLSIVREQNEQSQVPREILKNGLRNC